MNAMQVLPKGNHIVLDEVIQLDVVEHWKARADKIFDEIYQDYFTGESKESFFSSYLGHTSLISRLGAWRFFSQDTFNQLRVHLLAKLGIAPKNYWFGPLSFLRYTFPEMRRSENQKKSFLC